MIYSVEMVDNQLPSQRSYSICICICMCMCIYNIIYVILYNIVYIYNVIYREIIHINDSLECTMQVFLWDFPAREVVS